MAGLAAEELAAVVALSDASLEDLREAAARMPRYQRSALRWLARELELVGVPAVVPAGPALERSLQRALLERSKLERTIAQSGATPEEKAFLQQNVAHLWRALLETKECPTPSRAPR